MAVIRKGQPQTKRIKQIKLPTRAPLEYRRVRTIRIAPATVGGAIFGGSVGGAVGGPIGAVIGFVAGGAVGEIASRGQDELPARDAKR